MYQILRQESRRQTKKPNEKRIERTKEVENNLRKQNRIKNFLLSHLVALIDADGFALEKCLDIGMHMMCNSRTATAHTHIT